MLVVPFSLCAAALGLLAWFYHRLGITSGIRCRPHPSPLLEHPSDFLLVMASKELSFSKDGHLLSFGARLLFPRSKQIECARTCQTAAVETDGE